MSSNDPELTGKVVVETGQLKQAGDDVKKFGDVTAASIEDAGKRSDAAWQDLWDHMNAVSLAAGAAITAAVMKTGAAINEAMGYSESVQQTASMFGLLSSEVQGLTAAAQAANVPGDQLALGMGRLNTLLAQARDGSREAAEELARYGVTEANLRDSSYSTRDALDQIIRRIHDQGVTAASTAEVVDLFGARNSKLVHVFSELEGGIAGASAAATEFGALTDDQISTLGALDAVVDQATIRWENMRRVMAAGIASALLNITEQFRASNAEMQAAVTITDVLKNAWIALSAAANVVVGAIRVIWGVVAGTVMALASLAEAAARLLVLDFDGAKAAWNTYGEHVVATMEKVRADLAANAEATHRILMGETPTLPESGTPAAGGSTYRAPADKSGKAEKGNTWDFGVESREQQFDIGQLVAKTSAGTLADIGKDTQDVYARMRERQEQYADYLARSHRETVERIRSSYASLVGTVGGAVEQSMTGVMRGSQSLEGALLNMGQSIAAGMISRFVEIAENWVTQQLVMTTVAGQQAALRTGIEQAAAGESVATTGWAAMKMIATKSAEAMASAYAAIAAIPYVGPFLAPAAAVAAGAVVTGYIGRIASAEGGYDIPAGVNPLTQLHKREMVLPEHLADRVRAMTTPAAAGGDRYQITINAMDSQSFTRYAERNWAGLATGVKRAYRNGAAANVSRR